jgi:hypothetical protein
MKKVTGGSRKLNNENLRDICCSPNFIQIIKENRLKGTEHMQICCWKRSAKTDWWGYLKTDWWGYLKQRDHFEDLGLDRKIILKG